MKRSGWGQDSAFWICCWLCVAGDRCDRRGMPSHAMAGTFELDSCIPYTFNNGVFSPTTDRGMTFVEACANVATGVGGLEIASAGAKVPAGTHASWGTTAPAGLRIVAVVIPYLNSYDINTGDGWGGGFFFGGQAPGSPSPWRATAHS